LQIRVFFFANKGLFFVYMALSFCQHIVLFWIFHALSFHGCQASSKNSQLNHTIESFEAHLMYDFDELSISIIWFFNPYLHFTISFSHLMFQICSIHNFWYLGFIELTCQNYWYMLFPNFLKFENFRFISQFLSSAFLCFSDSFLRKWNLNFIFLVSWTSNMFNHAIRILFGNLNLKMLDKLQHFQH